MDDTTIIFLQNLMRDTISIDLHYYHAPFNDITSMDAYLRNGLQNSAQLYDALKTLLLSAENHRFYIIRDKYQLNYIYFRPFEEHEDIISVGPYITETVDDQFLNKIIMLNNLDYSQAEAIRGYLFQFPVFDNNLRLISIMSDILNFLNPMVNSFEITELNVPDLNSDNQNYTPVDDYEVYAKTVEKRYELENKLLEQISTGDSVNALITSKRFISFHMEPRITDAFYDKKALLYSVNTLLRKGAEKSGVHPIFLHQLSTRHAKIIDSATTQTALDHIHEKMIRNYCLLVKNKGRIQYSALIRNVLNYIEFNISHPLSLSSLAEEFHVTSPYLSTLFKKELGSTITEYIMQQKIRISLKLLNTTNMQIQEIASYVGIFDVNYFTKQFKKVIGCTPRDYRKNIAAQRSN